MKGDKGMGERKALERLSGTWERDGREGSVSLW